MGWARRLRELVRKPGFAAGDRSVAGEQGGQLGDDLARKIVVGRAETAREDQQIASTKRIRHDRFQHLAIVSGNRLPLQIDADLVEPLGNEKGVGVDVRGRQHFTAYRNDLCPHDSHPGAT